MVTRPTLVYTHSCKNPTRILNRSWTRERAWREQNFGLAGEQLLDVGVVDATRAQIEEAEVARERLGLGRRERVTRELAARRAPRRTQPRAQQREPRLAQPRLVREQAAKAQLRLSLSL